MTLPATNPLIAGPAPEVTQVEIPADGATIIAHMSRPKGVASAPAVVVIHAQRGLQPVIRDTADGLASSGYIAVAPDLLSRAGGPDAIGPDGVPDILPAAPRDRPAPAARSRRPPPRALP